MIKILSNLFRNEQASKGSVFRWRFSGGALCAVLLAFSTGVWAQTTQSYAFVTSYDPDSHTAYLKRHDTSDLTATAAVWTFPNSSLGALAFSPDGSDVYVPDWMNDKVYVIDTTAPGGTGVQTLTNPELTSGVIDAPIAVAASEDYVYVLNHESRKIRRISLSTRTVDSWIATLPITSLPLDFPYAITINDAGTKLYVSNHYSVLFIVDVAASSATTINVQTLAGMANPVEIWDIQWANTSGGKKLYVTDAINKRIHVFWEDGDYKTSIDLGRVPMSLSYSPNRNNRVYAGVICPTGTNNLVVINAGNDTIAANITGLDENAAYVNVGVAHDGNQLLTVEPTIDGGKMVAYSIATNGNALTNASMTNRLAQSAIAPSSISFSSFLTPAPRALGDMRDVSVQVTLTGNSTLYTSGANFEFALTCTGQGASNTTVTVTGANPYMGPLTGTSTVQVPEGATCIISENPAFAISGATVAPAFINGTSRLVQDPTGNADINTFEVEYYIRAGSYTTAQLTVEKVITGTTAQHVAANEFEIGIACTDQSSNPTVDTTVKLYGGASTTVTAFTGDECAISEPTLPNANTGYKYAPSIVPSLINPITLNRTITVTNEVIDSTTDAMTLIVENTVTGEKTASGYVQGRNLFNGITLRCEGSITQTFVMAEAEEATLSFPGTSGPANCTLTGVTNTNPVLNAAYAVNPTGYSNIAASNQTLTVEHNIYLRQQPVAAPIPTLDVKALILLIGLMFTTMLWQLRRRRG
jgi:Uncharacterized conserved protein